MGTRTYGDREVDLSREDKVLFPEAGVTKGDLADYYEAVAEVMLPHLEGRPLSLERYPDGIGSGGFYQKEVPGHFPDWITRVEVPRKEGDPAEQVICDHVATLVFLADQGTITLHPWLSRAGDLDVPDRLVLDLDPPDGDFQPVVWAARAFRDLVRELGADPAVLLTGSRGVHVVVPLEPGPGFDRVREVARSLADTLAERHPDRLTVAQRKADRGDRLYLDTARNAWGQTTVAPYAVRPRPGAPVAVPVEWDELGGSGVASDRYDLSSARRRLAQRDDPWIDLAGRAVSLDTLRQG